MVGWIDLASGAYSFPQGTCGCSVVESLPLIRLKGGSSLVHMLCSFFSLPFSFPFFCILCYAACEVIQISTDSESSLASLKTSEVVP